MRLIVPLVVTIFVLHIPRHFFSQSWDPVGRLDDSTRIEWNYFEYVPQILGDNFAGKLGPLWFLNFIFYIMIMNYPMIRWSYRRKRLIPFDGVDCSLLVGHLVLWALWNG